MKLITRDIDYALRAVCFIAKQKNKIVSVSELVKELKIPKPFLRKLLQILNKKGILRSCRGQGGGFLLAKPAGEIFLLDLIKTFQGALSINECIFKKRVCPDKNICLLKQKIDEIERNVISELRAIAIASLL